MKTILHLLTWGIDGMNDFSAVLVLTNDEQSELVGTLCDLGYDPLIRKQMATALREVHHKQVAVLFLDLQCADIDALELVINVRDIDQDLPVVIVNGFIEGKKEILKQPHIFVISKALDHIKNTLSMIL